MRRSVRGAARWVFEGEARGEAVVAEPEAEDGGDGQGLAAAAAHNGDAGAPAGGTPPPTGVRGARIRHQRLRFWVAIGIVIAAVSTAAGAWRAEIFAEYATQKDALARQALTGLQLSERSDEEVTMSDLRQLGNYQRDVFVADRLQRRADRHVGAGGPAAQNQAMLVAPETDAFRLAQPTVSHGRAALVPTQLYRTALAGDLALASFDPSELDAKASQARGDAVRMAAVAVFFALVVVLLTLSEMVLRRHHRGRLARWRVGPVLAATSFVVWSSAFVWFVLLYLDVPKLK